MKRPLAALLLLGALGLAGCGGGPDDIEARAAALEQRLLASCSCHPKKIEGLPLQGQIRASIREGIEAGQGDDAILWAVLEAHGTELLRAGIQDVETRALVVAVETPLVLLGALVVLLLQVRR